MLGLVNLFTEGQSRPGSVVRKRKTYRGFIGVIEPFVDLVSGLVDG